MDLAAACPTLRGPAWPPARAPGARGAAAALAAGLTLVVLALLGQRVAAPTGRDVPRFAVRLLALPLRPPRPPDVAPDRARKREAALSPQPLVERRQGSRPSTVAPSLLQVVPPFATVDPATSVAAPAPASAPLRLDAAVLGKALSAAEGRLRREARQSGVALDSPRATRDDQLGAAIAETGRPDCLGPNANGSLLSVPLVAYQALTGKCR